MHQQSSHHYSQPPPPADMATNITFHEGAVKDSERSELLNQKGATIWLTGLSASGKVSHP